MRGCQIGRPDCHIGRSAILAWCLLLALGESSAEPDSGLGSWRRGIGSPAIGRARGSWWWCSWSRAPARGSWWWRRARARSRIRREYSAALLGVRRNSPKSIPHHESEQERARARRARRGFVVAWWCERRARERTRARAGVLLLPLGGRALVLVVAGVRSRSACARVRAPRSARARGRVVVRTASTRAHASPLPLDGSTSTPAEQERGGRACGTRASPRAIVAGGLVVVVVRVRSWFRESGARRERNERGDRLGGLVRFVGRGSFAWWWFLLLVVVVVRGGGAPALGTNPSAGASSAEG